MSMLLLNAMVAATLVCVAAYAQYRIPFYTAGRGRIALTRGVLAMVGAEGPAATLLQAMLEVDLAVAPVLSESR